MSTHCRSKYNFGFCSVATAVICVALLLPQTDANIFLSGEYQHAASSQVSSHLARNPFLEHAIISRQAAPFTGPTYLPPKEQLKCATGQQCVRQDSCQGGYYYAPGSALPKSQACSPDTDVCCTYRPPATPPTTTETPYVPCGQDSDCVQPNDCRNGEISALNYMKINNPDRCYAPEVCCRLPTTTLTQDGYLVKTTSRQQPASPQPTQPVYTQPETSQPSYRPTATQPQTYRPQPPTTQQTYRPQPPTTQQTYRPQPQQPQTTQQTYRPQPQQPQTTQQTYRPQPPATQQTYRPQPPATQQTYRPQPQQPQTRPTSQYLPPVQSTQAAQPRPQPQPTQARQPTYRPQPQPQPQPQPTRGKPNVAYLPPITDNRIPDDIDRIPESSNVKPQRGEDQLSPAIFPQREQANGLPTKFFSKCASALVCTAENYCNSIGVITDQPVNLTPMEQAFRVPLTDCIIAETGAEGKCCRDSNYVDPWPVNLAGVCASRNKNTKPAGIKDIDANFAEIPWQAMILKDSSKTLLCGGAIIGDEFVLTTATCVSGQPPADIRVKAGEWELGGTNEPLPFQLATARTIDLHPEYNPSTGANDMAIIRLSKRFEFASHIQPICISDEDPGASEQCITTGWGKQALQIHEEGAIMHVTRTSTASRSDCGADATGVCSATQFDACEFDVGSALACGSGSNVRLKGVYTTENACGEGQTVRFTKPDVKWINTAFADRNRPILKRRV